MSKKQIGSTMNKYKLQFVDRILDPVHGFIDLTLVESEIVQLEIFKRLESIKQLSLTNWIFPGAEHTRYIHSLGVMYVCDEMAKHLTRLDGTPRFNDGQRQVLRLAGLLHDIGHYPLSHLAEAVYMEEEGISSKNGLLNDYHRHVIDAIHSVQGDKLPDYMKNRATKKMHHETMGSRVIKSDRKIASLIKKYCPFVNLDDICDIIVGNVERVRDVVTGKVNQDLSVMVQLMHAELDADGIDYIMRDASFSGTSYGYFSVGLLLRNLCVTEYRGVEIVGIRPKAISVADQYLLSKHFSYTQVIFNRRVAALEAMANLFCHYMFEPDAQNKLLPPEMLIKYAQAHEDHADFMLFTDRQFWRSIDTEDISRAQEGRPFMEFIISRLRRCEEFESIDGMEHMWTCSFSSSFLDDLKSTDAYNALLGYPSDKLFVFHQKGITSEIKEERYVGLLERHSGRMNTDELAPYMIKRFQEGVCIINDEHDLHLLIDDSRSIISCLENVSTYVFRGYRIR